MLKLARLIADKRSVYFYTDGRKFLPHITIHTLEFPLKNIKAAYEEVEKVALNLKPMDLIFKKVYTGWGYIGVEFTKTEQIDNFHKLIIENLNPLREGRLREKYETEISENKYPKKQVKYIGKYGYHNVFEYFMPHLTLARFIDEDETEKAAQFLESIIELPDSRAYDVGVCEVGTHGTCTRVIKNFRFRN